MRTYITPIALAAVAVVGIAIIIPRTAHSASDSATATATIIAAIAIANTVDLDFASIVTGTAGSVVVNGADTRTSCSGVPACAGTVSSASFNVTGDTGATYAITFPGSATLTGPGADMTAGTFTSSPSGTGTLTGGAETLKVGATLTVGLNQTAGAYSGLFSVTVDYN